MSSHVRSVYGLDHPILIRYIAGAPTPYLHIVSGPVQHRVFVRDTTPTRAACWAANAAWLRHRVMDDGEKRIKIFHLGCMLDIVHRHLVAHPFDQS